MFPALQRDGVVPFRHPEQVWARGGCKLKAEINPMVVGVVIAVVVIVVVAIVWRGVNNGGNLPVGTTQPGNRGKGPVFDWMNHPSPDPKPGYQDTVQSGPSRGGPSGGISTPGGAAAGGGAPR